MSVVSLYYRIPDSTNLKDLAWRNLLEQSNAVAASDHCKHWCHHTYSNVLHRKFSPTCQHSFRDLSLRGLRSPVIPPPFSAWSGKPDMLRLGIVGMRGSNSTTMAIRLQPCMDIEYTPPPPRQTLPVTQTDSDNTTLALNQMSYT